MRKIMKRLFLGVFTSLALLCFSAGAWADQVSEVFECELEKGMTMANAQVVNAKWLAFMHANISKDITSVAAVVLVGKSDEFRYVDTYPDLATWAAAKAALQTEEGQAIEGGFEGVIECNKNKLYRLLPTE
jgi:hypothetical protein